MVIPSVYLLTKFMSSQDDTVAGSHEMKDKLLEAVTSRFNYLFHRFPISFPQSLIHVLNYHFLPLKLEFQLSSS